MPSLAELQARRAANAAQTRDAVVAKKEAAIEEKKEHAREKAHARAIGVKTADASSIIETAVDELAKLFEMQSDAERNLKQAQGDQELVAQITSELAEITSAIDERLAVGKNADLLTLLAEMKRAMPSNGACLHFGRKAAERGYFEELDAGRALPAIDVLKDAARSKTRQNLSPEQRRVIWSVLDGNIVRYFRVVFFNPKTQAELMSEARTFAEWFGDLHRRMREARADRMQEMRELDNRAQGHTVDQVFAGEFGFVVKLNKLTSENPWTFPVRGGTAKLPVWGEVYLEVVREGVCVVLVPTGSRISRTLQYLGLTEEGVRKEIEFDEDFDGLRAVNGTPFSRVPATRAFLCMAAGLKLAESEPQPTVPVDTTMAQALESAKPMKRGVKKPDQDRAEQGSTKGRRGQRAKDEVRGHLGRREQEEE